jgi:hypothetical protein
MQYVVVRPEKGRGLWLDPRPYLDRLASLGELLPPGARSFVLSPEHFDFSSDRCVKDLGFGSLELGPRGEGRFVLDPHPLKHSLSLRINYVGVRDIRLVNDGLDNPFGLGRLLLDEVLPIDGGMTHEMAFTGGSIRIAAADLNSFWDHPER